MSSYLLPLIFIDEIVGKYQFEELCRENSEVYIAPDSRGRTVYLADTPVEIIHGTWVAMVLRTKRFVDVNTGELVVRCKSARAQGGWFMKLFFNGKPILCEGTCGSLNCPVGVDGFKDLGIRYVEPPNNDGANI
nr:hypothetical protein [uncultured Desulfobulbus sp.]